MKGQQLNASIIAQTRLTSTEEFGKILLKVNQDGSRVLLRDVAKIELGGENYDIIAEFNGQPASGLGSSWRPVQTRWIPLRQSVLNWRRWNRSSRRV
ncbi:acriflavin resistance protein B [Escherichia coli]|uniref:Acriflavin resistance protein B n=1 Tax=Escherichia coli TaxID=562 RepID=A0A376LJ91_ECOLX|nr:acriflavin resistance protein B [Escherichia coli]